MNKLRLFIALILTVVTLSHSKPSQAAVGAFVGGAVLIAGLVISGGAVVGTIGGFVICDRTNDNGDMAGACAIIPMVLGTLALGVGLVVLDGEQGFEFRELTSVEASKLGVSSSDLAIYNSEVDQANMLMEDVKAELSLKEKATAEDSKAAWDAVKDMVSAETFKTMQKIVSQK